MCAVLGSYFCRCRRLLFVSADTLLAVCLWCSLLVVNFTNLTSIKVPRANNHHRTLHSKPCTVPLCRRCGRRISCRAAAAAHSGAAGFPSISSSLSLSSNCLMEPITQLRILQRWWWWGWGLFPIYPPPPRFKIDRRWCFESAAHTEHQQKIIIIAFSFPHLSLWTLFPLRSLANTYALSFSLC